MNTPVSPGNSAAPARPRWGGRWLALALLVAMAWQWHEIRTLRQAVEELRSAANARVLDEDAREADLENLRRELGRLSNRLGQPDASAASRPNQVTGASPATTEPASPAANAPEPPAGGAIQPISPAGTAPDTVRWSALPGSQVVIDGTSTIHDWTVKGSIIGGYIEFEPAFLTEQPVPRSWTNAVLAAVQAKIPVRSLKSQVLVGAAKMDEIMQEAMRMKEHPDITYTLETMAVKTWPEATNGPVTLAARGRLVVSGVTNTVAMDVRLERLEANRVRISGDRILKMTDFKIVPPSPSFPGGDQIRTGDEVKVRFEWLIGLRPRPAL